MSNRTKDVSWMLRSMLPDLLGGVGIGLLYLFGFLGSLLCAQLLADWIVAQYGLTGVQVEAMAAICGISGMILFAAVAIFFVSESISSEEASE